MNKKQTEDCLSKLLPRLQEYTTQRDRDAWRILNARIENHFRNLFRYLYSLYGHRYDFFYYLEEILKTAIDAFLERPADLKSLDLERVENPSWYNDNKMIGATGYADLFAGDLKGVRDRISYLKELRVNYFHLMPCFDCPPHQNDGGYAVSSYRKIRSDLGTMDDFRALSKDLRNEGISLCADFIFNHTASDHTWAELAKNGIERYQNFYHMFDDRSLPDRYDETLREIFPDVRRGNFSWEEEAGKWVWTTFHNYQWDLNYQNPDLFNHILGEMLFLANAGVEILRLDAIAFTGKKMGTTSENQPEAHYLVRALNALTNIAAPAVVFKSEAIVHPDHVNRYISPDECELSYNPLLMALLWEALATRDVGLLYHSMEKRFQIPEKTAWVNYVRSHDDIGWTFSDEDAAEIGINGYDHRNFLNKFYSGEFEGSFARGEPFQFNPDTGDMRICGTSASLSGRQKGEELGDEREVALSVARITLLYSVTMFIGGIPLIYLGDELGMLNDYSYEHHPDRRHDSRWLHRTKLSDEATKARNLADSPEHHIFSNLQKLADLRTTHTLFGEGKTDFHMMQSPHIFSFIRSSGNNGIVFIGNFSDHKCSIHSDEIPYQTGSQRFTDLWSSVQIPVGPGKHLTIEPYQFYLLEPLT